MTPSANALIPDRQRTAIDNLIRRELKVGDPRDPNQLARALMERYQDNRRAQAIDGEARGLPFLQTPIIRAPDMPVQTAIEFDLELTRDRVRADLQRLLTENLSQTMRPELEGWHGAIQHALDEGVSSARMGLDPARRDVAFAMRRQLGEYARLARLVGLFSPALRDFYRALAASLDDAAIVILVLTGESMANVGFSGGRFLLQTSYADLQARRDAVLSALRRIDGISTLADSGAGHWPRGLRAHRQLNLLLEASGQGDLRSLLSEAEMARVLDGLIQLASGGSPQGLRSLGSTVWSPLARLRRFVRIAGSMVEPASHELAGLQEAMQLFIEGFEPAGGFRLLRITRPALLTQTAGGLSDEQPADRRLLALAGLRGALASLVESWLGYACSDDALIAQAALDRVLFDVDRAIDHYANGSSELGLCEIRASAAHMLTLALEQDIWAVNAKTGALWKGATPGWVTSLRGRADLVTRLSDITAHLRPLPGNAPWDAGMIARYDQAFDDNLAIEGDGAPRPCFGQVLHDELANSLDADRQWLPVIQQLATHGNAIQLVLGNGQGIVKWQEDTLSAIDAISDITSGTGLPVAKVPEHFEISLDRLAS